MGEKRVGKKLRWVVLRCRYWRLKDRTDLFVCYLPESSMDAQRLRRENA